LFLLSNYDHRFQQRVTPRILTRSPRGYPGSVKIRHTEEVTRGPGYDTEYTAASIAELEEQLERGEIEPHAYFIKKQALVRLYLKSTTKPARKKRGDLDEL